MKNALPLLILLSLASRTGQAARCAVAPADTLPGQTRLTRSLAADACQWPAAGPPVAAWATMSPVQAQEAFEQALSATIEKQVASIKQVAQRTNAAGAYDRLRADLPTTVALQLFASQDLGGAGSALSPRV